MSHKLNSSGWDCVVYVYAPRSQASTSIWLDGRMKYISSICSVVENTNKRVTDNLFMVQPALIQHGYRYVFILLDDCKLLGESSFDIDRILAVMEVNKLTLASPLVEGANIGGGQKFREIMQTGAVKGTEGYISTFVEYFSLVLTPPAWHAFWELVLSSA